MESNFHETQSQTEQLEGTVSPVLQPAQRPGRGLIIGWVCLLISALIPYVPPSRSPLVLFLRDSFILNMGIAISYSIFVLIEKKMRWPWKAQPEDGLAYRAVVLMLWLASCFALNRSMSIFSPSDPWLTVYILGFTPALILIGFKDRLSGKWLKVTFFLLALQLPLWTYFSLRMIPLYIFGFFGIAVLGIGLHAFIPLWASVLLFRQLKKHFTLCRMPILAGLGIPLILTFIFVYQRVSTAVKVRSVASEIVQNPAEDLPHWIRLAQRLPGGYGIETYLAQESLYDTPFEGEWLGPRSNNESRKQHNPFVYLATLLTGKPPLTGLERQQILKLWATYPASRTGIYAYLVNIPYLNKLFVPADYRHFAERRLWSGVSLVTSGVKTSVEVLPEYGLAYTEKELTILNPESLRGPQEAIYTFYLPEGAAVTSLSLWINGKEEPGLLTTRQKADSAYTTIVGVESRDPAIVHWQEGNRVSVRVFPCTKFEERRFKIGVTAPLSREEGRFIYQNIQFEGPSAFESPEQILVRFSERPRGFRTSIMNFEGKDNDFKRSETYTPHWTFSVETPPLVSTAFSFNGKSYSLNPYQSEPETFVPDKVYLDINKAWSSEEFESVTSDSSKAFWVYLNGWKRLTAGNKTELFRKLAELEFSLFPVHRIAEPDKCLLITKGTMVSPLVADLKESNLISDLECLSGFSSPVKTFVIGDVLSPYQKTLKSFRAIQVVHGELEDLNLMLKHGQFVRNVEQDDSKVLISPAGMVITEAIQTGEVRPAPDHLLRLFAYNQILKGIGGRYFSSDQENEELVRQAETAYVVSPVSSLVVLESQKDYDRFDIKKSKNSLQNAGLKKAGAVPEPHEWALIGLLVLFMIVTTYRHYVH